MAEEQTQQQSTDDQDAVVYWEKVIDGYRKKLQTYPDPREQAQFHFVIGQLKEERIKSDRAAVIAYQVALKLDPKHKASIQAIQRIFVRNENWNGALKYTDLLLGMAENDLERSELYLTRGRIFENANFDLQQAVHGYEECLRVGGPQLPVLLALEGVYSKTSTYDRLIEIYHQQFAFLSDPTLKAAIHVKLGRIYEALNDERGAAREHYRTALNLDSDHFEAFHALESMFRRQFQWRQLAEFYTSTLENLSSEDSRVTCLSRLADLYCDQFLEPQKAIETLEQLRALRPDHIPTMMRLEDLYREAGQFEQIPELLGHQAELAATPPEKASVYFRLGYLFEKELNDSENARMVYQMALENQPDHQDSLQALLRLGTDQEDWESIASITLQLAGHEISRSAQAQRMFEAAEIYFHNLTQIDSAESHLKTAIDIDPSGLPAIKLLSRIYAMSDRFADLVTLIEQQLDNSKSREQSIFLLEKLASIHEDKLDSKEDAAECYGLILELSPGNINALRSLGRLYFQMNRWDDLIGVNAKEAELAGDVHQVVNLLTKNGEIYEEHLEDDEKAIACYEKALNISPNFLPALRPLERIYAKLQRFDDLMNMYQRERQVVFDPKQRANLDYTIAQIREKQLSNPELARDSYQSVLAAIPDHKPSQTALKRIYRDLRDWESLRLLLESQLRDSEEMITKRDLNFELGDVLDKKLKREYQAVAAYYRASVLDPAFQPAREAIERILYRQEDYPSLVDFYKQMLENVTDKEHRLQAMRELASLWRDRLNNLEQASVYYEQILLLEPADYHAFGALEQIYRDSNNHRGLVELYKGIAQQTDDREFGLTNLIRAAEICMMQLASPDEALELYGIVLANEHTNRNAMNRLEEIFYKKHKWRDMMMLLKQRISVEPENIDLNDTRFRLGLSYELLEKSQSAIEALQPIVDENSRDIAAVLALQRIHAKLGDDAAAAELDRLIAPPEVEKLTVDPTEEPAAEKPTSDDESPAEEEPSREEEPSAKEESKTENATGPDDSEMERLSQALEQSPSTVIIADDIAEPSEAPAPAEEDLPKSAKKDKKSKKRRGKKKKR